WHGLGNRIEGELQANQKVVVIEDLVSTGKSSLEAVEAIKAAGAEVIGMCALFTYGFPQAEQAFAAAKVELMTISNYAALMELAERLKIVDEDEMKKLAQWRLNPDTWRK